MTPTIAGEVVVTWSFSGSIDFGGETFQSVAVEDMFVARYGGAGNLLDFAQFGSTGFHSGTHIATSGEDGWSVAGYARGAAVFNNRGVEAVGAVDSIVAWFSA